MRFLAVLALMASVAVARPAEANIQQLCQGVCLLVRLPLNMPLIFTGSTQPLSRRLDANMIGHCRLTAPAITTAPPGPTRAAHLSSVELTT